MNGADELIWAFPPCDEPRRPMTQPLRVLDLFAGTGVGVACKRLGFREMGVEIMPEAIATRTANGMATIYHDVWEGLVGKLFVPPYDVLWASPPCQTFSMAGSGAGRRALDEVLEAIRLEAWKDPQLLLDFGEKHDMRTALVLTPLAHVWRDRPQFVALEQVPTVLPVWEACAVEMRKMGYSVQVANLHAEQYGVPQTRKRAILVARLDGPVALPMPTHSKYYQRTPERLDEGVAKWISMAEALGADTLEPFRYLKGSQMKHAAIRSIHEPAMTIAAGHSTGERGFIPAPVGDCRIDGRVLTMDEAATLQSYPVFRNGNQAHAAKRTVDQPAPTLHFGQRSNKVEWMDPADVDDTTASGRRVTTDEAATLQSYPSGRGLTARPSPTICGGGVDTGGAEPIMKPGRYTNSASWQGSTERLTSDEAAILQSYEPPFVWVGTKSKVFLQIGNAVPPLLAQHILAALTKDAD